MNLRSLTAFIVPVRLRKPVRHASHERHANETLLVRSELADGSVGWGEGLPRPYVTGETTESVLNHCRQTDFGRLTEFPLQSIGDISDAMQSLELAEIPPESGITVRECFGNSVRCAVEVSLVDAVGRHLGLPAGRMIPDWPEAAGIAREPTEVRYSGVITSMSPFRQIISAAKMKLFGFRQVKVKVGTEGINDADSLRRIRRVLGGAVDIRLDANEAWHPNELRDKVKPLLPFRPTSLEQPVPHDQTEQLGGLRGSLGVPIMLDESLCCIEDARRAVSAGTCDLFNLRLSKCGGILPCIELAVYAKQHGLACQLGCQVGETGILSAAGRHFAGAVRDLKYLEGSYDRFLVRDSFTQEDLTFRYGGVGPVIDAPGLGVTVDEQRIREVKLTEVKLVSDG